MGGRQKTTTCTGNEMEDLREKHGNRQEGTNGDRQTTERQTGWMVNHREMSRCRRKGKDAGVYIKASHRTLTVITERADPSLVTQGWVCDKPCLVTIDAGAYVTVARHNIAIGWPEWQPNQRYTLQTISGESLPFLNEVFLTVILGRCPLKIWVFVASIINLFILGLDILHSYTYMHLWT
jgi:hypothetical protein